MIMVVLICAYLIRYLGSGPNWLASIMMYDEWCRENGYLNALYLHNFIHTEHTVRYIDVFMVKTNY